MTQHVARTATYELNNPDLWKTCHGQLQLISHYRAHILPLNIIMQDLTVEKFNQEEEVYYEIGYAQ